MNKPCAQKWSSPARLRLNNFVKTYNLHNLDWFVNGQ